MPLIELQTVIKAPIQICFDEARNLDLHQKSTAQTKEKAIAGKTTGYLELGESVTWRAKHLGFYQELTSTMEELESPHYFKDVMVKGTFKKMEHIHRFKAVENGTLMTDHFYYESPMGVLGKLADQLFLKRYLTNFIQTKNTYLKEVLEENQHPTIT
ncbi:MAG: SRPBCC family protein [Flavobacteriales bacterium]|nr:SRPBCC family protein [Flavobacteriales bacterium]